MKLNPAAVAVLLILGINLASVETGSAQTRLGLHVTQEELNIWKQRMQNGPYKSGGDVQANSPGDWDRIVNDKNIFLSNPSSNRWAGQTVNSCVQPYWANQAPETNRNLGRPLLDAAFYYLVSDTATDRETVRIAVRNELLAQAATGGTDFSNRTRWCQGTPYGPITDENPSFDISNWLTRLLFAYDYIRPSLMSSEKNTLDTWFLNAATYWVQQMDRWLSGAKFPNRDKDDYSNPTDSGVGQNQIVTHYGGYTTDYWTQSWANRGTCHIRFGALVGIMLNNTYLKDQAKRYVKEWIRYSVFADNTIGEMYRWDTTHPALGWNYSSLILNSMLTISDAFARIGDFELFNYSTSVGYDGTAGGPKTLLGIATLFARYVNHDVMRYGTNQAGHNGDANYLIDTVDGISGEAYSDDVGLAQGNVYFKSAYIKSIYMRTANGAPAYPPNGGIASWQPWTGEWGVYPGVLLMFGQMEGKVSPYSTGGSQLPSINFAAVPDTITSGQSSVLTWSTSNATSCTGSGSWTGTIPTSGTQTVTLTQSTTYTLSCIGTGGTASQSTTVTVSTPSTPPAAPTNVTIQLIQ